MDITRMGIQVVGGGLYHDPLSSNRNAGPSSALQGRHRGGAVVHLSDALPMLDAYGPSRAGRAARASSVARRLRNRVCRDGTISVLKRNPARQSTWARFATPSRTPFCAVWPGAIESDGQINALVLQSGLSWRDQVVIVRAYARTSSRREAPSPVAYMVRTMDANPEIAKGLVTLFRTRFDPEGRKNGQGVRRRPATVASEHDGRADEDRILRQFLNLLNWYSHQLPSNRRGDGDADALDVDKIQREGYRAFRRALATPASGNFRP